jgi:hypothetical protein
MENRASPAARICGALAMLALCAAASGKETLSALAMEHFRDTATVVDAPQDAAATISTEKGFSEKHGPMRTVWDDEYFVATIDKKSAQKSFQVIVWVTYSGSERLYQKVSFDTPQGPKTLAATPVSSKKEFCTVGDCTYTERLAFPVEEAFLRDLAGRASASAAWSFQMTGKSGPAYTGVLTGAEAAGLLAKVDGFHGALPVVAASATRAALQAGMGIEGLPVAADTEHPNRHGILITYVAADGVARQSGLIVGDILYELNGHPLRTLVDLEREVAGCAPSSTVPVKFYRGLADTEGGARF